MRISLLYRQRSKLDTIPTNQVAGAGAIALNGNMELIQRSAGMGNSDYDEPQFFDGRHLSV